MRRRNIKFAPNDGFTLLEVLVSLSIVAVGVAAAGKMLTQSVVVRGETEKRFIANLVSSNYLNERIVSRPWESGPSQASERMGGYEWEVDVKRLVTPNPDMIRLDVSSTLQDGGRYGDLFYYKAKLNQRNE